MSKITIPPAALEAGARTLCNEQRLFWRGLRSEAQNIIRREARVAFIAMLEAWPGMWTSNSVGNGSIILPMPTENTDE